MLMKKVFLSGYLHTSIGGGTVFNSLKRSEDYMCSFGYDVFNPLSVCVEYRLRIFRWLSCVPELFFSDIVVFPTFWKGCFYAKIDMFVSRLLGKSVLVKKFD